MRTPTIHLAPSLTTAVLSRRIPRDWSSTGLPVEPLPRAAADVGRLRQHVLDTVFGEPGRVVIDTGLSARADHELTAAVWNLFVTLFAPRPQYRSGELLYPVEVSSAPQASSHYSQSAKAGGFHTDGTLLDDPPDVAALAGLTTADEGGETVIVDVRPVVGALSERRSYLDTLVEDHPFHSGDPAEPVVWHPIVTAGRLAPELKYMRRYVEFGYQAVVKSCPRHLVEAMDELDAAVSAPVNQSAILIERGQVLVWDNRRCLHGRRAFVERARRRKLLRMYGARTPLGLRSADLG